jgi:hypothetical protein
MKLDLRDEQKVFQDSLCALRARDHSKMVIAREILKDLGIG